MQYLSIKPIFLRYSTDGNEPIGSDLTRSNTWYNAKSAIPLDIGQESIVGILILVMGRIHDMFVVSSVQEDERRLIS